ncbi:MAG TPA: OsmC family protein [Gemmatimonadaceae bacterium]|nr:OsmC family protein [Gemmatimonadaceae bacterium]
MTTPSITPSAGIPAASPLTPQVEPAHVAPNRIFVQWQGALRFDSGRRGGPVARIDGRSETGPSPVDTLLGALATCAASDVVEILAKRRTPVTTLEIEVEGTRATSIPRRLTHVALHFRITGEGIEQAQAERAIDLAITKYCSVRDSLDPTIPIEWTLALSDEPRLRTSG